MELSDKGWERMAEAEKAKWLAGLKGAYTHTDLDWVGHNVEYLADLLGLYGYSVSVSPKTDWQITDIPRPLGLTAFLADLNMLKTALALVFPSKRSYTK